MQTNTESLPRWASVQITMGDKSTRTGKVLVDHGDRVTVEYQSAIGAFQCRRVKRSTVTLLPTTLCGAAGSRGRVCAAGLGHVGDHQLVLKTVRED